MLSFTLSYWIIVLNPVINYDGILYLQTADRFLQGDWGGGLSLYAWPFYSLIVAAVSTITSLNLESSAHLITAFSAAMLTYVFLSIVDELDKEGIIPFFIAAFVIVFFSELNETRNMIIRGHQYWAFYLLAIFCFLRFYKTAALRYGIGWNCSILIATLFRIEGIVFLLILPFVLLFCRYWKWAIRVRNFLAAHLLNMAVCLALLGLYWAGADLGWFFKSRLVSLLSFVERFWAALAGGLADNVDVIQGSVLNIYSEDAAVWVALLIPGIIIIMALVNALTPLYTLLLCRRPGRVIAHLKGREGTVLIWVMALNLLIFVVATLVHYYFFERYVMPLVFILLFLLSFDLAVVFHNYRGRVRGRPHRRKWVYYLLALILVANSGEALIHLPGDSKRYLKIAGVWLKQNVSEDATIFTNNIKLRFYSGRLDNGNLPAHEMITVEKVRVWKEGNYDYLAFWVDHRGKVSVSYINELIGYKPIQKFSNREDDFVLIYRK